MKWSFICLAVMVWAPWGVAAVDGGSGSGSGSGSSGSATVAALVCWDPGHGQASIRADTLVTWTFATYPDLTHFLGQSEPYKIWIDGTLFTDPVTVTVSGNDLVFKPTSGYWVDKATAPDRRFKMQLKAMQDTNGDLTPQLGYDADNMVSATMEWKFGRPPSTKEFPYTIRIDADCTAENLELTILAVCRTLPIHFRLGRSMLDAAANCGSFVVNFGLVIVDSDLADAFADLLGSLSTDPNTFNTFLVNLNNYGLDTARATMTATAASVAEMSHFKVDVGEGVCDMDNEPVITFRTSAAFDPAAPDGTLTVTFPTDWIVAPGMTAELTWAGGGSGIMGAGNVNAGLKYARFILSTDASRRPPLNTDVTLRLRNTAAGQIHTPPNCDNFLGWVWGVYFRDHSDVTHNFVLANPSTDACHGLTAIVFGDPHFVSFSGGEYDIRGAPGKIYNIITDRHFQWNARFVFPQNRGGQTYIGESGFLVNGTHVIADPVRGVLLDNVVIPRGERVYLSGTQWFVKQVGEEYILIRGPGYRVALKFASKAHKRHLPHFDMVVEHAGVSERVHPHGLLGQTSRFEQPVVAKMGDYTGRGIIEGGVDDYLVPSLFSTKFTFNQYKA